jgi:hypothetical protein
VFAEKSPQTSAALDEIDGSHGQGDIDNDTAPSKTGASSK